MRAAAPASAVLSPTSDNRGTTTTRGCHTLGVRKTPDATEYEEAFRHLNEVRAEALVHARRARELAVERRNLINNLVGEGFSQAQIGREMGVTRQAVQKMLAL